jgi:glucose/arabinose dehydrogenase
MIVISKPRVLIILLIPMSVIVSLLSFGAAPSAYGDPHIKDPNLKVEQVVSGLASPTSMAFVAADKILVLEKNSGNVLLVTNGILQDRPVLKLNVDHTTLTCCRGLLGIAVENNLHSSNKKVYLYLSESLPNSSVRNRVYQYKWNSDSLLNPLRILDLPATPGPNHPGGKLVIGKDGYLYTVIGDLNNEGLLQNIKGENILTDTSVIIKIDPTSRKAPEDNPFFNLKPTHNAEKYYGYGVRNSFGLAIDPITGALWDTENGDKDYDEINYVAPGFNSGWRKLMGPISKSEIERNELVHLPNSKYIDPAFNFSPSLGVTGIEFLNSSVLGPEYKNNIFVGDINNGNLYFFKVNSTRNGFDLSQPNLSDLIANGKRELSEISLGSGFGGITDIKTGPDGSLYILTFDEEKNGDGKIYRITKS